MNSLKLIFLVLLSIKIICIIQDESSNTLLGDDNFNVFKYSSKLENDTLIIYKIVDFALNNLIGKTIKRQIVDKKKLYDFLLTLAQNYNLNTFPKMNPYHNLFHAADVVHTLYIYLSKSKNNNPILFKDTYVKENGEIEFISNINYNDLDIFALIIAAACHDFKHTARDNSFYSNYNNKIPFATILKEYEYKLELYHFAEAKKLIEEIDLLEYLNNYQKERFYKIMKISIYGTDNSLNKVHAEDMITYKDIMKLKSNISAKEIININISLFLNSKFRENYTDSAIDNIKLMMFECFLHAADISNPTKNRDLFLIWSDKYYLEFCEQSKEIHSFDETKEIICVGDDDQKFRELQKPFFENIIEVFFFPFCDVFDNLNYLCDNYKKNKELIEGIDNIH